MATKKEEEEDDVNFVSSTDFQNQRSGNQSGKMKFYGNIWSGEITTRVHNIRILQQKQHQQHNL